MGVVERKNHTLCEAARSMLLFADFPQMFWAEATAAACYTQNRSLIIARLEVTPYEAINKRKPNVTYFHIFGCRCYIKNNKDQLGKFAPKGDEGIFLGYCLNMAAYRVLNKRTRVIEETKDVKFDNKYIRKLDHSLFPGQMVEPYTELISPFTPPSSLVIPVEVSFEYIFPPHPKALDAERLTSTASP